MGAIMKSVGRRLREDRGRLGWSVETFAERSGIHPTSVGNYERGERAPNAALLLVWHDIGIDIGYVLVGVRWGASVGPDEQYLLDRFQRLDDAERSIIMALISRLVGENIEPALSTETPATVHDKSLEYKQPPKED